MRYILFTLLLLPLALFAQDKKSYLYLQNGRTEKIKKINLNSSYYISFNVDSSNFNYNSFLARDCFEPERCVFGTDSVNFHLDEVNYHFWKHSNDIESMDSWNLYFENDTSVMLPYTNSASGFDMYLSRQSKIGRGLFITGCGIVYAALVNAFFIAPLRGLNQGSFNGYSTQRLWQGELYSGIGLAVGLPIMFIFDRKDYYFQNPSGTWDTWVVVDEGR